MISPIEEAMRLADEYRTQSGYATTTNGLRQTRANLRAYLTEQFAEAAEQARLNGMGAEREARLMAQVAELQRLNATLSGRVAADAVELASLKLRTVGEIERDDLMHRDYIPLPGGWELQTKGKGSTLRLVDTKTGERHPLPLLDYIVAFIERMGYEIHCAYLPTLQESQQ